MRTTIYEPVTLIRRLQDEMNRALGSALTYSDDGSSSVVSHWVPAVDVHDEPERFLITADVPGVKPDDIEVSMDNGVLTLNGERKLEKREDLANKGRRIERVHGTFYRRFTLPDSADAEKVEARTENGVLEISIPKKAQVLPKKIKVAS